MSKKRKLLLYFMIGVIVICFGIALFAISNNFFNHEKSELKEASNNPVKTGHEKFDEIANEVEENLKKKNSDN